VNTQYLATIVALTAGVLSLLPSASPALGQPSDAPQLAAPSSAKDIYFRPTEGRPARDRLLALNYKILLKRGERTTQVPPDYVFQHGDCFRIAVQANTDGYLYLLHKGSTGAGWFLFPDARIRHGQNDVTAYCEHLVPESGWFEFDGNPGNETIHVILASQPLPQLAPLMGTDPIPASRWRQVVEDFVASYRQLLSGRGTKDIVYVEPGQDISEITTEASGSPALPVGPDAQPGLAPGASSQGSPAPTPRPVNDPVAEPLPAQAPSVQSWAQGAQVFVAQAAAPTGDGKLLVHSICLKHE
jgi:hypothetical protein